jgi:hypothetical protein
VPAGAAWAVVLVGAAMIAAPIAPVPTLVPAGVGVVPAAAPVRADEHPVVDLLGVTAGPSPPPPSPPPPPPPPVRLHLPALGVDAAVTPVDTGGDGGLVIPDDPEVVGWWRGGAAPGSAAGSVVLVGHVDTRTAGPGALFRAAALRPGDRVVLGTDTGDAGYAVAAVRHYPKAQLPTEVFATAGTPRLVLVTCGGAFDRRTGHYADNVVVYAVPEA